MSSLEFLEKVKRLVIIAMFSDDELMERLVLKGGNLLDIVYGISTRGSVDVDFSIDGEFEDLEVARARIERTLQDTFAEAGYVAFDLHVREVPDALSDEMRSFWGGYQVDFKIIGAQCYDQLKDDLAALRRNAEIVGKRASTKLNVQISKHECCHCKQQRQFDDYTIYVYSPEMVVCEKLRAICQQMPVYAHQVKSHPSARARDFVDIHTVVERFEIDFRAQKFRNLLREVFAVKRVGLNLIASIGDSRDYHRQDFAAVRDTVKPGVDLKDFDFYFDYVVAKCRDLEPFGDE